MDDWKSGTSQLPAETLPTIHCSNGTFLVFTAEDAKLLRRSRIMNQTVASGAPAPPHPLGPPYCISNYAAMVAAKRGLARFVQLKAKSEVSLEDNRNRMADKLIRLTNHEREMHMARRMTELRRHNVPPTPKNLGGFDETKMRLTISERPDKELASFEEQTMDMTQVREVLQSKHTLDDDDDENRRLIYEDLYERGFFVSSGMKFGSDFLAYLGDPVRYHAEYAVRLVACSEHSNQIDLTANNFSQLNCLQRLTHTANKIPLFATIFGPDKKISYWTLRERAYLAANSLAGEELRLVDPRVASHSCEQIKMKRTS